MIPVVTHHSNLQKKSEMYYQGPGLFHRPDGPAVQYWHITGQKLFEEYYINGVRHRTDGPASQDWYCDGELMSEYYYINGKEYTKEEFESMDLDNRTTVIEISDMF